MSARRDLIAAVAGVVLLGLYVVQACLALEWPWLVALQADDTYKTITGLGLAAYLLFQWALTARRRRDPVGTLDRHRIFGALAPVVFYLHASRFGYGYLLVLAVTYLGTMFIGLLNRPVLAHARAAYTAWFVIHVATAAILVVLAGYHVAIALAYE